MREREREGETEGEKDRLRENYIMSIVYKSSGEFYIEN